MGSAQDADKLSVGSVGHSLFDFSFHSSSNDFAFVCPSPREQQAEILHRNIYCNTKIFAEWL